MKFHVVKLFHSENNHSEILNGASAVSLIAHLRGLFCRFLGKEEIKPLGMVGRTKFQSTERPPFICCNIYFAVQHINST